MLINIRITLSLGLVLSYKGVKLILGILINFFDSNVLKIKISQICWTVFYLTLVFFIFCHKYSKTKPTLSFFIDTIKWVKISEYKIAKQSGNLMRYFDKWNCIW